MENTDNDKTTQKGGKKTVKKTVKKGGKRPMNAYMLAVNEARKAGKKSFMYKGTKYVQSKAKTGLLVYRKAA